jgi:MoaA/NifB/PqqE/SkfB family radical SAM enzyme
MCYNNSGSITKDELSDKEWIQVVHDTAKLGILEAVISGGEPLMRGEDLVKELFSILTEYGVSTMLITNGWFVTKEFARELENFKMHSVQVSIDGPVPETHDLIRGRKGSFERAVRTAHFLSSLGQKVRISCVLQRANWENMEEMIELAIAIGAVEIAFDEFLPIGRGYTNFETLCFHRNGRKEMLRRIDFFREKYNPFISILEGYERKFQLEQLSSVSRTEGVVIRPDGELRLNCVAPFSCGNIREKDFHDLWEENVLAAWRNPKVTNFVESVTDNFSLKEAYRKIGVIEGEENATLR